MRCVRSTSFTGANRLSLNPIEFGQKVIHGFGRYLLSNFPIADSSLSEQLKTHIQESKSGDAFLFKGPYVRLHRSYEEGAVYSDFEKEMDLHPATKRVFPFERLHHHQEQAIRSIKQDKHTVVATSTGSGKTEGFLIPIIDHCVKARTNLPLHQEKEGIMAIIVYPMNALVNDQMKRLRPLLAGTGVTFAKYTGDTPYQTSGAQSRLVQPRKYTPEEIDDLQTGSGHVPAPYEECVSREEIRERRPNLLLTNYKMLEYLLLRPLDLKFLTESKIKFIVFDEVHTYSGTFGSEVACLIRRLKTISKETAKIICIGTSATVAPTPSEGINPVEITKKFASRIFGVPEVDINIITESHRQGTSTRKPYVPKPPADASLLLDTVLAQVSDLYLRDEIDDIPLSILESAQILTGVNETTGNTNLVKLYGLLVSNRIVHSLEDIFTTPRPVIESLNRLRTIGNRKTVDDYQLLAEVILYLVLGAIAQHDGEPLLKPKIHYFVQGLQGLWASPEPSGGWQLHLNLEKGRSETPYIVLPLNLCRTCGQHYFRVVASSDETAELSGSSTIGIKSIQVQNHNYLPTSGEEILYLTDRLVSSEEESTERFKEYYMCMFCGTLHSNKADRCLNVACNKEEEMIHLMSWPSPLKRCHACGSLTARGREVVRSGSSGDVADIMILAQTMLSNMPEEKLRKVLIFADNRQDAAFQAGWMEKRSKRFRLRHLLFQLLEERQTETIGHKDLIETLIEQGQIRGILPQTPYPKWNDDEHIRVRWFIIEEFASTFQRRSNIENLGLAEIVYHGLSMDDSPEFFKSWSEVLGVESEELVNVVRIILDNLRRRGVLSEPLLSRLWRYNDREYREGLIRVPEFYSSKVTLLKTLPSRDKKKRYVKGFMASTGRTGVQEIVAKACPDPNEKRDEFVSALFEWLIKNKLLIPTDIVQKRHGKLEKVKLPKQGYQVNLAKMGIKHSNSRTYCPVCRKSQSVPLPNSKCPEWRCRGITEQTERDEEHYDVFQYTKSEFIPMNSREHSAQVPRSEREEIEKEFKRSEGEYNVLVCTPTLELGVDIGQLEMVLMRNVPPTPANYAQRSGRAGRRHRIAVVFTYCRSVQHDRYFFNNPPAMISGQIRVPAFSLSNEPLVRKHVHSVVVSTIMTHGDESDQDILKQVFPSYIRDYFTESVAGDYNDTPQIRYLNKPPDFREFVTLINKHRTKILQRLKVTFTDQWTSEDLNVVSEQALSDILDEMPAKLAWHIQKLFKMISTYRRIISGLNRKEDEGIKLSRDEENDRRRYRNALNSFQQTSFETYSLTYLSDDGFFPGYALSRETCLAQCFEPYQEMIRPLSIALREFSPANLLYANRNVFAVQRLNFYKFSKDSAAGIDPSVMKSLAFDRGMDRVIDPRAEEMVGGEDEFVSISSFELTDVALRHVRDIDDTSDLRRIVGYAIYGMLENQHSGGKEGRINEYKIKYLRQELIRLVNLGPKENLDKRLGFPVCPRCGGTRSPFAGEPQIESFEKTHKDRCGIESILWGALHVEFTSDVIVLGPFRRKEDSINIVHALQIGAEQILDMTNSDIEGFIAIDSEGNHYAVLFDPMPGGSGFLLKTLEYWNDIVAAADDVLDSCNCETACYSCMMHFRNQQHHSHLNRHQAIECLSELRGNVEMTHDIPPAGPRTGPRKKMADSKAEEDLIDKLEKHSFPLPPEDHKIIELSNSTKLEADYYYPDKKVIVLVDGMSRRLHGGERQKKKDAMKRALARREGYQVAVITAQGIHDDAELSRFLTELAVALDRLDLSD